MKAEIAESAATLDAWDRFVARHPHGTHAQMSWWLAAHRRSVVDTRVVCCRDGNDVHAGLAVYRFRVPVLGTSALLIASGPLATEGHPETIEAVLDRLEAYADETRAFLLQFEAFPPSVEPILRARYAARGAEDQPIWKLHHPALWRELRVPLTGRTPEDILAGFNQSTRRKIRTAQKKGVQIDAARDEQALRDSYDIWIEDAQRQSYTPRPYEQVKEIFDAVIQRDCGELLVARIADEIVAFNFILHFGIGTYYFHGGYRMAHSSASASHILQYEAMCRSLRRGATYYSLAAPGRGGLLQYKAGFGGDIVNNTRFVSAPWRRWQCAALRPIMGQIRLMRWVKRCYHGRSTVTAHTPVR